MSRKRRDPSDSLDGKRPAKGQPIKRYTPKEVAAQLRIVNDAWIEGATLAEIKRLLAQAGHDLGTSRVKTLQARVQDKVRDETDSERPYSKARQTRRITRAIRDTKGTRAKDGSWLTKPDHSARAKYEDMIAKIEGNYEPIKVEVDAVHRHAVIEVMAGLSDEQWDEHVRAFDRMRELAEAKARENGEQLADILPRPKPPTAPTRPHVNGRANGVS